MHVQMSQAGVYIVRTACCICMYFNPEQSSSESLSRGEDGLATGLGVSGMYTCTACFVICL